MSTTLHAVATHPSPGPEPAGALSAAVEAAARRATRRVAPLWPLRHFVAVNPFLGLADMSFEEAARVLPRAAGSRLTMPRSFYAEALRSGRMDDRHLAEALAEARERADGPGALPADAQALRALALAGDEVAPAGAEPLPTVADALSRLTGRDWQRFATERYSAWAASYFDEGLAPWPSPWRHLSPYAAWRAESLLDRTPEVMGVEGFRDLVAALPEKASDLRVAAVERLGLGEDELDPYLHRLLMSVGGWAAYGRYRVWESELAGRSDETLMELLAIRLAWEVALLDAFADRGAEAAWSEARAALAVEVDAAASADTVLHDAYEKAFQEEMVASLSAPRPVARADGERKRVQAVFCIDVRSEVFRRALESLDDGIETLGFAGFFGFPLEVIPLGQERGGAQCPVLLTPGAVVAETLRDADPAEVERVGRLRRLRRRASNAWKAFKLGAVSCFAFVGPVGLAFVRKLVTDGFGRTRPVPHPSRDRLDESALRRLGPGLEPGEVAGRATGLPPEMRLEMAQTVLRAMSLTEGFARIVLLAGHGSTTVNNPHATGLDCGACGGHTGEANARVAVAVLNDPEVRRGLAASGLPVPEDTLFLAGLHDTATDEVQLFDADRVPASHVSDLARLRTELAQAGRITRRERAGALKVAGDEPVDEAVTARSRDWSQVRPEWGLAGCALFVAAPRHRTAGLDLEGRSFLHSYAWRQDEGFGVLELIMTAPMVVASWISLQYYGSTVDNRAFGSGNKVLHNVVGALGVLEGNGGDLRTGLPWQSVHDGERFVHEPLRLNVVIEAPLEAMNDVLAKHDDVRELLDHGWLHLWAMDDEGRVAHRYAGSLSWQPVRS